MQPMKANEKLNTHHFVDGKQALDIMNCKQINNAKVKSTVAVNKQSKQQKCSHTRNHIQSTNKHQGAECIFTKFTDEIINLIGNFS